jgi:acyl carrier protein
VNPQTNRYTAEELESWLVAKLSEELRIGQNEINIREPLANYGLDSITAVSVSGELEDMLGLNLSATLLWEYPSIEMLAGYLSTQAAPHS